MQRFAKTDKNKNGRIDLAAFEEGLQISPGNDYVRQLFEMFGVYNCNWRLARLHIARTARVVNMLTYLGLIFRVSRQLVLSCCVPARLFVPKRQRVCWLRTDQDGDGVLDYAEFVSGLLWINNKVTDAEAARFAFALLDTNKDGRVDRKDAENAVANHRMETLTQEQVTELFRQMDPDGRGWIEEADAVQFVRENP